MSTLLRHIERPAILDRPAEGQLSIGLAGTPKAFLQPSARGGPALREAGRALLPDRLRPEQTPRNTADITAHPRTDTARGGEATLDELFVGAWEGLSARRPVACPVCAGAMHPHVGAGGGACSDCGAQLR